MDAEEALSVSKPTTLQLRHSNNSMIDKITASNAPTALNAGDAESDLAEAGLEGRAEEEETAVTVINECKREKEDRKTAKDEQPCAIFGQLIDNEDETWELLSHAASWESSFPKEILTEPDSDLASPYSGSEEKDMPLGWKKISDSAGSYYWNTTTGKTQTNPPTCDKENAEVSDFLQSSNVHTGSGLEDADINEPENSREGHMFCVRSLGWLPMEAESLKPEISSAAVNSCIGVLSNNRSQIMDGVGVWGEGKDLMLLLNNDHLKIVDPLENTVLQSQPIQHIRVWGVGRDSSHDFAYVVRDPSTKVYKCHVFRCDAPAHAIAKQLHTICTVLVKQRKLAKQLGAGNGDADIIPIASSEPRQVFEAKYLGSVEVKKPTGISILKEAIHNLVKDTNGQSKDVSVSVSASALEVTAPDNECVVNCRMRYLSFMGVDDDVQFFGFINVVAGEPTCHVLQCVPNAAKLALAVQEACMLRYQKAIDSKQPVKNVPDPEPSTKSLKSKVIKLFSGLRRSGS